MKVFKIMSELLKLVEKGKTISCKYGIDDNYVYFTPDGYRMFKIYKPLFLIDIEKALPKSTPLDTPGKFFKEEGNLEEAIKTNEMRVIDGPKRTIVKIVSEKSHAWINVDFLKDFESECTFKIGKPNQPVFIYELGKVVGLVLPVRVREDINNDN